MLIVIACCLAAPTSASPYQVFGTKRYHRSSGNSRSQVAPAPVAYQPHAQQYYDEPSYLLPSESYSVGDSGAAAYAPETDNSYYYVPRRESQYYGLPTYRGEYKPKPYYYAHGPSYSYYDDRNEQANPLDDLHEEMQLEDERERQREMPVGAEENWYDNQQRPDKLTNTFLKNLILYNKELAVNKERQYESPAAAAAGDFEDYEDPNTAAVSDYYEQLPQEMARHQLLLQQQQQEELQQQQMLQKQQQQHYQKQQRHPQLKHLPQQRKSDSYADGVESTVVEDKDVQELKSLANKSKQRKTKQEREQQKAIKQQQKQQKQRERQQQKMLKKQQEEQERQLLEHERQQQQRMLILQQQQQQQSLNQPMYTDYQQDNVAEYEAAEPEYDETSWINWDRKRSLLIDMEPRYQQPQSPPQFSDHFFGFDDRKPVPIPHHTATVPSPVPVTTSSPVIGTTIALQKQQVLADDGTYHSGQKEVVLPRPATPVRHPFSAPVLEMLTHNAAAQDEDDHNDTHINNVKSSVYDTIKQLLTMDQKLNKVSNNILCFTCIHLLI